MGSASYRAKVRQLCGGLLNLCQQNVERFKARLKLKCTPYGTFAAVNLT
jgi:hypothetical protein